MGRNSVTRKLSDSGFIEVFYLVFENFFSKLSTVFRITVLRLRGYVIEYSCTLGRNVVFFQSKSRSIWIGKGSRILSGVRIKAGFDGRISVGKNVTIEDYTYIHSQNKIEIGDESMIAANCYIVDFNHKVPLSKSKKHLLLKSGYSSKPVKIGKYVWIGANVVILPGVTVGDDSVIGAGSVVTKNVPSKSIAVGNPAKVIDNI